MSEADTIVFYWQDFANWFVTIPLLAQILLIIAAFAIIALAIILVYYVLKGVAYLIYYLFKGLYYLFKGIGMGIYKLGEALYYAISGKQKPIKQASVETEIKEQFIQVKTPIGRSYNEPSRISFCNECGAKFTRKMNEQLNTKGQVYCVHCGNIIYNMPIDIVS
ncbi:MAG: hypothetical protein JW891_18975 [Candidatus Lokiarchaeota archaeon]|nr:hypothetical protein [Candidatus Lokiarchaeota archaeon]